MTNTALLEKYIKKSGLKRSHIAAALGLTPHGLANKIKNETEFKAGEIARMCELLDIPDNDREKIFFAGQ